jgi:hypothetical protein
MSFQEDLCSLVEAPCEDKLVPFLQHYCLWFGFRAQPLGVVEEIAADIESRYGQSLQSELSLVGVTIRYGSRTETMKLRRKYRQCYGELRLINQILHPSYQVRVLRSSLSEPEHGFLVASADEWATAGELGNLDALFSVITKQTDFKLGPFPGLTVNIAEALTRWVVARLLR